MPSISEQILERIKTTLAATAGVDGRCWRSRRSPVGPEEMPAIIIKPDTEAPSEGTTGGTDARTDVLVEVFARGLVPDSAADPVRVSAHSLLMTDATQGGLAIDTSEAGTTWDLDDSDEGTCKVTMRFTVWHRHARNDLSTR